jgi:hypothetical protein
MQQMLLSLYLTIYLGFSGLVDIYLKGKHRMNNFKHIEFIIKLKYKCSSMLFKWKIIILFYQYKSKNRWILLDKFAVPKH